MKIGAGSRFGCRSCSTSSRWCSRSSRSASGCCRSSQHAKFEEMAENNHQRTLALRAPRGVVFDRDGQRAGREPPLLQHLDRPRAHQGPEPDGAAAGVGARHRRGAASARSSIATAASRRTGRSSIVQDATLAQVAAVMARRLDFELPDVVVEQVPTRRYPDTMAAHLFGYVGEVSDKQVADNDALKSGDIVGQSGIEKIYNAMLMGEDGARRVVVNSVGREIRTLEEERADRRQAPAADDRLRRAESGRGRLQGRRLQRRGGRPRSADRRGARLHEPSRPTTRTRSPPASIARRGRRSTATS